MSLDSIISLLLGIPLGLVSGLYTGLIMTRYSRFADLRNEALRIIRAIDFMASGGRVNVSRDEDVPTLLLISSDLIFLSHKEAGMQMSRLSRDVTEANYKASVGGLTIREYEALYLEWQQVARELPPSKRVLWAPWGKL